MSDYYEVNGEDSIEINPFTEALLDELEYNKLLIILIPLLS